MTPNVEPETRLILDRCVEVMQNFVRFNGAEPGGVAMHPQSHYVLLRDRAMAFYVDPRRGTLFDIPLVTCPTITEGAIYALPDRAIEYIRRGAIQDLYDVEGRAVMYRIQSQRYYGSTLPPISPQMESRLLEGAIISMPPVPDPEPPALGRVLDIDVEPLDFTPTTEETSRDVVPVRRKLRVINTPFRGLSFELQMVGGQPTAESVRAAVMQTWNEVGPPTELVQTAQKKLNPAKPRKGAELGGIPVPMTRQLDIIDEIDELVEEQMTRQPREWKYSGGDNCPYCAEPWHGLAITTEMKEIRKLPFEQREAALAKYSYARDTSDVICPGSPRQ